MKLQKFFQLSVILLLLFLTPFSRPLFADFKLLDAIEEFGEKRAVKPIPPRLRAGPVRFHPILQTKVAYDDNSLLQDEDKRDDVIFNVQPGAIVELPIKAHQISVGYLSDFEWFNKARDAKQNHINQNFFALADFHFPSWYINLLEQLEQTSSRSGTTFTERIPRVDQSFYPKVAYRWKRTVFESGYRNFVRNFRNSVDNAFDFRNNEWTEVIYYDLFARLKALLEYQVAHIRYDHNAGRKGTFHQVRTGFEGDVLPNVTVKLRVGPQFRNYTKRERHDFNSWVMNSFVQYQVRRNFKATLGFDREAIEATFQDVNFYKHHAVRLGFDYLFRPKWTLFQETRLARDNYAERATVAPRTAGFRRDKHLGLKAGLRYQLQEWLSLELAYEFILRDSNFPNFDYNDNRFTLSSALTY